MQSCAEDFTAKSRVPGKLLAIKSLGFKETSNQISLKEIDPYTVRVIRTTCKAELLSIEQQALLETKQGKQSFDCSDAYATYIAHNITALGVPLLYDSVTGFNLLKDRCTKKEPVYQVVTTENNGIVTNEAYDDNTTACEELPVADVLLTANIDAAPIYLATSADGIASLPPEKITQLERAAATTLITYKFEAIELTTRYLRKKPEKAPEFGIFAVDSPAGAAAVAKQQNEAPPPETSVPEIALAKGFVVAPLTPPATEPLPPPTVVQSGIQSSPPAPRADSGEKVMARDGREAAGRVGSAAPAAPGAVAPEPAGERLAGDIKAAPAPAKITAAETPVKAKSDDERAGGTSSPPGAVPEIRRPEPVGEIAAAGVKAAPAPAKITAAVTPAMAQPDQDSTRKSSSRKIAADGESSPKAGSPLRDESKSTAPAPRKTLSPAMARSQAKTESAAQEVVFRHILIMRPELNGVCCPLTEKLFWNIGK